MQENNDNFVYRFVNSDVLPNDDSEIPIITLSEKTIKARVPYEMRGKKFSIIALGLCNFACPYCVQGGGDIERLKLPKIRMIKYGEIRSWLKIQSNGRNPIKVTGGEPLLMPSITKQILYEIKKNNGYSCLETNGSFPERIEELLPYTNLLAVDIKGTKGKGNLITRRSNQKLYWDNPIETLRRAEKYDCDIEVRTIAFDFTTLEDLLEISQHIPDKAYWTIKRFIPELIQFDGSFIRDRSKFDSLGPLEEKLLLKYADKLVEQNPSLRNRLIVVRDEASIDGGVIK